MTQQDLADAVGVSVPAVSAWEKGRNYPAANKLPDLAAALGVTVGELYGADKTDDLKGEPTE